MNADMLTDHFTLRELGLDDGSLTAAGRMADAKIMRGAAGVLCYELLEPLRRQFGPITVNDGFRDAGHNAAVGGKKTSYHLYLEGKSAADVLPKFVGVGVAFDWLRASGLPFDKVILEFHPSRLALLEEFAAQLNAGVPSQQALADPALSGLSARCIHLQQNVNAAPRREAYVGFTGNGSIYKSVPVTKKSQEASA